MAWIYLLKVLEARALESVCLPDLRPPEIPKGASVSASVPSLMLLAICSVLGQPSVPVMQHPRQSTEKVNFGSAPQRFGATNL